ncbi:conserved Plasmodium protein, unknown function [Plasmodium vinckei vinckei]|uniref:Parasitophorous vacuolar protein 2 n=1 Tax=Plasmodium vinckei vinckei TaxID=54757 RepID=A0A449C0H6_PLAVN|nr:conserved Plasmodium protein, unknown function [Plasmodium vinckei vinckei]KEG04010.1 hypothetical protein YYE_00912 [Plasmodium vinckei vinckei]VEV59193.1 conserved Plasmodium protein, unknown function [Plasmodium vinckei vinckei]
MAVIKYVITLFIFSTTFLNALKEETQQTESKGFQFSHYVKEKVINMIAKQKGYDTNGWVNLSNANHDINNLSFRIDTNGDLICNSDNHAVEISITDEKILKQTADAIFSELSIVPRIAGNSASITKIPIKRPKNGSNNFFSNQNAKNNLPLNSEAYLVCTKKNANVMLIPKHAEKVEFIPGPWLVRASVNIYKDPLKPFGRAFRITVVDGVNVLANKQNSFIWFMPLKSFSEVYHFHLAAKDSKNGTYCNLERSVDNKVIKLHCPSWGTHYKLMNLNIILGSLKLGMTMMHNAATPYLRKIYANNKELKLHHLLNQNANPNLNSYDNNIYLKDDENPDHVNSFELNSVDDLHNDINDSINKTEIMNHALNVIVFGILAISNSIYMAKEVIQLMNKLKEIDIEFENARPFYEWTITQTENNYQPDMALETKKKIYFPELNSLNNSPRKDETIKKFQDVKNNNNKPTNEKKLERIIISN